MGLFSDWGRQSHPWGKLDKGLSPSHLQAMKVQPMALGTWVANTAISPHPQWPKPVASTYVRGSPPVFDSASPRLPFLPGRSDWCFYGGSWWLQPPVSAAGWAEEALVKENFFSFSVLPRCHSSGV